MGTPDLEGIDRRGLLKLLGASAALALGVPGCTRKPRRRIVSRADGPEYQKPGAALCYGSTWTEGPFPYGIVVRTVDGRPVKIEGNPDHPVNAGASSAAMQASILSLYDPDRLGAAGPVDWAAADRRIVEALRASRRTVLVTRATLGPSERDLVARFLRAASNARHLVHEAVHDGPRRAAWRALYGADGEAIPRFDRARVVLSLDSDFLGTDGAFLENTRRFAEGRALDDAHAGEAAMSRLYAVESAMTLTGSCADHRLAMPPSRMAAFAAGILEGLAEKDPGRSPLVNDLRAHRGAALVVAGPHLPRPVHETVARINHLLDAPGRTLEWNPAPPALPVTPPAEIRAALAEGADVLLLLDVNPVYDFPGGGFEALLPKAGLSVGHGLYADETVSACAVKLPGSHVLESWNDAAPRPGVESIAQPVIAPLHGTRQAAESLLRWTQALLPEGDGLRALKDWHDFIRQRWGGDRRAWEDALRAGGRFAPAPAAFPPIAEGSAPKPAGTPAGPFELVLLPHPALHDGRFANNAWLQELPDPVTRAVWDGFASLGPGTAKALGASEGDLVTVRAGPAAIDLPALVQNGMADGVVALTLGHGRSAGGEVLRAAGGANAARLLGAEDAETPRLALRAEVRKSSGRRPLVRVQDTLSPHGREIVLDGTLAEYRKDPDFVRRRRPPADAANLYEPYDYSRGPKWAMSIDLGACTGCGACVLACQAENNVPPVGREECGKRREMHWIRVDRYEEEDGRVHHQPMLCQHCDHAPCETVCPVNATTHSPEGLNEMVYNRCVGTRYCANNCPYKVRRFNYYRFQERLLRAPVQELVHNPQVTVRGVGVMEKCTFCVQRITEAKFRAKAAGTPVPADAVRPACGQACPARAITFGDANPAQGPIARARASRRAFHVLDALNVKPNVTYLARVRNPHPEARGGWPG
jgi:molybdopterin-containing oxidoreductase family iron-sulfur binding subunit